VKLKAEQNLKISILVFSLVSFILICVLFFGTIKSNIDETTSYKDSIFANIIEYLTGENEDVAHLSLCLSIFSFAIISVICTFALVTGLIIVQIKNQKRTVGMK